MSSMFSPDALAYLSPSFTLQSDLKKLLRNPPLLKLPNVNDLIATNPLLRALWAIMWLQASGVWPWMRKIMNRVSSRSSLSFRTESGTRSCTLYSLFRYRTAKATLCPCTFTCCVISGSNSWTRCYSFT